MNPADQLAVALLAYSAAGHGMEIAPHWQEGWPLGLFFAVVTAVLVGQAVSLARRPSATTYATVVPTTVVLIVLYFVVREITVPFMDHRDPYLWSELVLKAAESVLLVVAAGRLWRAIIAHRSTLTAPMVNSASTFTAAAISARRWPGAGRAGSTARAEPDG